ncbi:hypothetical protein [Myxococcus sp. SDU36]|uniref:PP2C family protein-serine/threonine phosphatase n=1 Tax=Myxococcus sp. SDU36 TaxID=2831967 RepID=UPI0025439BA3|nr:hypothetical protein [Myxococcus sp. SDU36]WIG98783.1 hypothetical protein KGD87_16095 [Myxococcus sp. SDU36]
MYQLDFAAQADRGLVRESNQDVAAALGHGQAVVARVGDSRCYLVRDGAAECLTHDHSEAAELRRQGLAGTPEQRAAAEQYQNVLTRCIDGAAEVAVDAEVRCLQPGDALVLCSVGLWGGVAPDAIVRSVVAASSADARATPNAVNQKRGDL